MTNIGISILDTGFIKKTNEGTQASTANRVNDGDAFTLKTSSLIPNSKLLGNSNPEVGSLTLPSYNIGSLEIPQFTLQGSLDLSNATDNAILYLLWRLPQTYGYKAMFYNVKRIATYVNAWGRDEQLITLLANSHYDTTEPQGDIDMDGIIWSGALSGAIVDNQDLTDVYHIHVIFTNFTPNQTSSKKFLTYNLQGVIL